MTKEKRRTSHPKRRARQERAKQREENPPRTVEERLAVAGAKEKLKLTKK